MLTEEPRIPPEAEPLRPVLEGLLHKDPLPGPGASAVTESSAGGHAGRGEGLAWRLGGVFAFAGMVLLLVGALLVLLGARWGGRVAPDGATALGKVRTYGYGSIPWSMGMG